MTEPVMNIGCDIGWAMEVAMNDKKVARSSWKDGRFLWVTRINLTTEGSEPKLLPVILLKSPEGQGPWQPTQMDVLATDWKICE